MAGNAEARASAERSDARRNRDAILVAARRVFARDGLDAPMSAVAMEAGVSRATQYRHFPKRDGLLAAIFDDNFEAIQRVAEKTRPPERAYAATLATIVHRLRRDRAFVEIFDATTEFVELRRRNTERYLEILAEPLRAAQGAGVMRADLRLEDSVVLTAMLAGIAWSVGDGDEEEFVARGLALLHEGIGGEVA